jgi:hypothetical protein
MKGIDLNELLRRGFYCTDWDPERIAQAKRSQVEYVAYCLWKYAGEPEGRDLEFWKEAEDFLSPPDTMPL